jgi:hypothetical protein
VVKTSVSQNRAMTEHCKLIKSMELYGSLIEWQVSVSQAVENGILVFPDAVKVFSETQMA